VRGSPSALVKRRGRRITSQTACLSKQLKVCRLWPPRSEWNWSVEWCTSESAQPWGGRNTNLLNSLDHAASSDRQFISKLPVATVATESEFTFSDPTIFACARDWPSRHIVMLLTKWLLVPKRRGSQSKIGNYERTGVLSVSSTSWQAPFTEHL